MYKEINWCDTPKEFKFILTAAVGAINLIYFIRRSEPKKLLGLLNLFYVNCMCDSCDIGRKYSAYFAILWKYSVAICSKMYISVKKIPQNILKITVKIENLFNFIFVHSLWYIVLLLML